MRFHFTFILTAAAAAAHFQLLQADPEQKLLAGPTPAPTETVALDPVAPDQPRTYEFEEASVVEIFRQLATDAVINLQMDDRVEGDMSIRLEEVTPMEAIQKVALERGYQLSLRNYSLFVADPPDPAPKKPIETVEETAESAGAQPQVHEILQMLKTAARDPEMADAAADFHWNFFQALLERGFTSDQAMQILVGTSLPAPE